MIEITQRTDLPIKLRLGLTVESSNGTHIKVNQDLRLSVTTANPIQSNPIQFSSSSDIILYYCRNGTVLIIHFWSVLRRKMYQQRSAVASAAATAAVVTTTTTTTRRRRRRPVAGGGGVHTATVATIILVVTIPVVLLLFLNTTTMTVHSHMYHSATNTAFIVGGAGGRIVRRISSNCSSSSSGGGGATGSKTIKAVRSWSMPRSRSTPQRRRPTKAEASSCHDVEDDEGKVIGYSSKSGSGTPAVTTTRRQVIKVASSTISAAFLLTSVNNNIDNSINNNAVANALTPTEAEDAYDKYAPTYNQLDGDDQITSLLGIDEARTELFQKASGRVLEIGCGTGLNLPRYDYSKISSITLMDISQGMINEAQKRLEEDRALGNLISSNNVRIEFVQGDATSQLVEKFSKSIEDGDSSDSTSSPSSSQSLLFDTVVDSFSLCVMGNDGAKRCLQQMSKVVKPTTGKILLLENSRSSNNVLGWYQDITASNAASMGGKGCVYNQDVRSMIENLQDPSSKLQIINEQQYAAGLFRSFECRRV